MNYLTQTDGSCCVVYAIANSIIAQGGEVSPEKFEKACDIACCRHGSTIGAQNVVDFLGANLEYASADEVFRRGTGILSIYHPILNGHAVFIKRDQEAPRDSFTFVNSYLGPNVMTHMGRSEIEPFIWDKDRKWHWAIT